MLDKKEKNIYEKLLNEKGRFSAIFSILVLVIGIVVGLTAAMLLHNATEVSIVLMVVLLTLFTLIYSFLFLFMERRLLDFFFSQTALPMLYRRIIALLALDFLLIWLFNEDNKEGLNLLARFLALHSNFRFFLSFYLPIIIYIAVATYVEMQVVEAEKSSDLLDDL